MSLSPAVDPASREFLEARGLDIRILSLDDRRSLRAWSRAVGRGFHEGELSDEQVDGGIDESREQRIIGVYDPRAVDPETPVGTVASWVGELTLPEGGTLPSWAIAAVTVAPTHAGRGIARAMLEEQLRSASAAGVPMAMLTVSESTLYGRYGFAPATFAADLTIDARRAGWVGPTPGGRIDFITIEQWAERIPELFDRGRRIRAGDVDVWPRLWARTAGLVSDGGAEARKRRAVQYSDERGELRGLLLYAVKQGDDFPHHTLEVLRLEAETDDAYAALWRYALQHPLVGTVTASLRPVDEQLRWLVADMRAIRQRTVEHEYLRVLDVAAVLAARGIESAGAFSDPLGIAGPQDAGSPSVRDLASAYLGAPGTRALPSELATRLATDRAPYLSTWY